MPDCINTCRSIFPDDNVQVNPVFSVWTFDGCVNNRVEKTFEGIKLFYQCQVPGE